MSVVDLCRLCLATDNLVWVFDKRFESSENMKEIIYIMTGVEITMKDMISQKICEKCCQVTIKMFEFRRTSQKNNKYLTEQFMQYLQKTDMKIPNTNVTIRSEIKGCPVKSEKKKESKQVHDRPVFKIHPTVRDLFNVYPQIKLPTVCLKSHILPVVSMPMDGVENYFKERNLDFNLYTKLALKSGRVATKKTSAPVKPKVPSFTNSSSNENKILVSSSHAGGNLENISNKSSDVISDKCVNNISKIIVDKANNTANNFTKSKSSNRETHSEKMLIEKKRKFSEVEDSLKKENIKKPTLIESLGLAPKTGAVPSGPNTESPAYVANVSVPLHICDICNSVQYSAKDLRRHQNKHLRCQFCKLRFRNLESKSGHLESKCVIKNTMNNLPDVVLKRIEYDIKIRKKYPDAFTDFAPFENDIEKADKFRSNTSIVGISHDNINHSDTNSKNIEPIKGFSDRNTNHAIKKSLTTDKRPDSTTDSSQSKQLFKITHAPGSVTDVIEILSDDEDVPTTSVNGTKETNSSDNLLKNRLSEAKTDEDHVSSSKNGRSSTQLTSDSNVANITPHLSNTIMPQENIVYNTVSIVKPDIRIKGNHILDTIDPKLSDIKLLKELLNHYMPLTLFVEKNSQTELPANDSISVINHSDATTELKSLKQYMIVYKIPVVIKNGPFKVSYNYHTETKLPKKLCLWNDLTPIDIKTNNISASVNSETQNVNEKNSHLENNNYSILPSTATYNSSGFYSLTAQVQNTPQHPTENETSVTSLPHHDTAADATNFVCMNPLLNNILETQHSTSLEQSATFSSSTTSLVSESPSTSTIPIGTIRVKNVWELT